LSRRAFSSRLRSALVTLQHGDDHLIAFSAPAEEPLRVQEGQRAETRLEASVRLGVEAVIISLPRIAAAFEQLENTGEVLLPEHVVRPIRRIPAQIIRLLHHRAPEPLGIPAGHLPQPLRDTPRSDAPSPNRDR
jgi:hypothetical protein